jgi:hypothetical protein
MPGENNNDAPGSFFMKTRVDALTTFPRPGKAANEEFVATTGSRQVTSGWNAYEVWLTRIKAVQDRPEHPTRRG